MTTDRSLPDKFGWNRSKDAIFAKLQLADIAQKVLILMKIPAGLISTLSKAVKRNTQYGMVDLLTQTLKIFSGLKQPRLHPKREIYSAITLFSPKLKYT